MQRPACPANLHPDVDTKNLEYAQRNVHRNGLESRVRMWASTLDGPLIPLEKIGMEQYGQPSPSLPDVRSVALSVDIVFTNPPFYPSASALKASAGLKARPPASACTGTAVEMVTAGGEVGFARRLALESKTLGPARVSWCATMLGQRASVEHVVEGLRALGCGNWAVGELVQGRRTRRWAVAWSWGGRRPNTVGFGSRRLSWLHPVYVADAEMQATARGIPSLPKHLLPFPSSFFIALPNGTAADASGVGNRVDTAMQSLEMRWRYRADWMEGVGFAAENVWSRAARRKKEGKTQRTGPESSRMDEDEESEEEDPALGVRIRVQEAAAPSDKEENTSGTHGVMSWQVEVRWLLGIDSVVFESFCGWLKRIVDR